MQENIADLEQLAFVSGQPKVKAILKAKPEDFIVEEVINYELSGVGEHLWCWVEKIQQNTDWVAGALAKWANTSKRNIGFAGQKDRHAITRQWFSVHLPGKEDPNSDDLNIEGVKILNTVRHNRKLQRGGLAGNRFKICLKSLAPIANGEELNSEHEKDIEHRLNNLKTQGFPNYFGSQRFGWNGNNLIEASRLFAKRENDREQDRKPDRSKRKKGRSSDRNKEGMYISAVRSWMFNQLLSNRIEDGCWNKLLEGDVVQLDGSSKWFVFDGSETAEALQQRMDEGDIHISGALLGDGPLETVSIAQNYEKQVQEQHPVWIRGLQQSRIKPDRRALRTIPQDLHWSWLQEDEIAKSLELSFTLPAGSFATMLIREILYVYEPQR